MKNELYEESYKKPKHFSFGKNWEQFLQTLNNRKLQESENSLSSFLGGQKEVAGKTFVDIGSGSGLFSLAAYRLGAKHIVSVDIDEFSLRCTNHLRQSVANPAHWQVLKGSALDKDFLRSLGTFDIVYSWGALHHTGDMYQALENVKTLANEQGRLYIALYNDNPRLLEGTSSFWVKLKRFYNHRSWLGKKSIEGLYTFYYFLGLLANGKNPFAYIKNYHTLRGMNFWTDIKDWLGGYPYEFASTEKIIQLFKSQGFVCTNLIKARSIGCNEYLFEKKKL